MGKHSTQFVVYIRPRFSAPEVLHGMPFVEYAHAVEEGELMVRSGNYGYRVAEINPMTGEEIDRRESDENAMMLPLYNDHAPLV